MQRTGGPSGPGCPGGPRGPGSPYTMKDFMQSFMHVQHIIMYLFTRCT